MWHVIGQGRDKRCRVRDVIGQGRDKRCDCGEAFGYWLDCL